MSAAAVLWMTFAFCFGALLGFVMGWVGRGDE